jgi:broad specificity phosphatase PhoE
MKVTAVLHFDKAAGFIDSSSAELAANPGLSYKGFKDALSICQRLELLGPFDGMFVSRLARALDTASVLAMYLNMDFQTMFGLGQAGNKEGDKIVMYPGFENSCFTGWQNNALSSLEELALHGYGHVLIVSHRPIIWSLCAYAQGITTEEEISALVMKGFSDESIYQFEYNFGLLQLNTL